MLEPLEREIAGVMDGTEHAVVLPGWRSGAVGSALEPRVALWSRGALGV